MTIQEHNHISTSKNNIKKLGPNKIRRKLLIGAATTPLILTLTGARAWGVGYDIRGILANPSKAERDGVGQSGILNGSGGGTAESELALYVTMRLNPPTTNPSPTYANLFETYDNNITAATTALNDAVAASGATIESVRTSYTDALNWQTRLNDAKTANGLTGTITIWTNLDTAIDAAEDAFQDLTSSSPDAVETSTFEEPTVYDESLEGESSGMEMSGFHSSDFEQQIVPGPKLPTPRSGRTE
ncbi:MAG: hypothetical protein Q4C96_09615 [Planctomycetia bacterium]|nr:hypothetical protein [Planctomycetia bacterium]